MTTRPDTVLLDSGRQVRVVEEITSSAPLGVRFWDWAVDRPVRDGLLVRARPAGGGPLATARPSRSGVYGFLNLPTTREAERGSIDDFGVPGDYVVGVWDAAGRYVPMCLTVAAPVAGVQPVPGALPPVDGTSPSLPGFALFSAATRPVPAGQLAVRFELGDADREVVGSPGSFDPAAHALVSATVEGETWYGVSDAQGRVLLVAPTPTMAAPTAGGGPLDLNGQRWDVELRIRYDRLTREEFPGVPDFAAIAAQADAAAKFTDVGFTASHTARLAYGEELAVTSPQRSDLLVKAPAHP